MTTRAHPAPSRGRTQHETPPLRDIAPKKGGPRKEGGSSSRLPRLGECESRRKTSRGVLIRSFRRSPVMGSPIERYSSPTPTRGSTRASVQPTRRGYRTVLRSPPRTCGAICFPPTSLLMAFAEPPLDSEPGHRFTNSHLAYSVLGIVIERVTRFRQIMLRERVLGLLTPTDTGHSAYVDPTARQAMATSKPAAASAKPPYVDRKGAKPWCTPRTAYLHPRFTRRMFTFPMRSLLMHVRGGTG